MTGDLWRTWLKARTWQPRYVESCYLAYRVFSPFVGEKIYRLPIFAAYQPPRWVSRLGAITCKLSMPVAQKPLRIEVVWAAPVQRTTSLLELENMVRTGDLDGEDTIEVPLIMAQKQAAKWMTKKL